MNTAKTQVSKAIGTIVKFGNHKTTIAPDATDAQVALFVRGQELGAATAEFAVDWSDALKAAKSPADRKMLRAGFVDVYMRAMSCAEKKAQNRFDYLAKLHSPETSRKRAKGAGAPEKTETGSAEKLSDKDVQARLVAILHYVATAQQTHAGDTEMLEVLGAIATLASGSKVAA